MEKKENLCPICLLALEKSHTIKLEECLHSYHINCIDKWFKSNKSCPLCRARTDKETLESGTITINVSNKCTICLDNLNSKQHFIIEECWHKFHIDCLQKFGCNQCPLCGKEFDLNTVIFLGGKEKYMSKEYVGNIGKFEEFKSLIYPTNEWITSIFNSKDEKYFIGLDIRNEADKIENNTHDWIIIKHLIYKREYVWIFGQVAFYSKRLSKILCYQYRYKCDCEPPDVCDMTEFNFIENKRFKMKSIFNKTK